MLGEFSITYDHTVISDDINQSKKTFYLLEYLITFRFKEISQNELIDLLWPDEKTSNPLGALKTLLHRTRKLLNTLPITESQSLILQSKGSYYWNNQFPCTVDIEEFEELFQKGQATEEQEQKLLYYTEALNLYKGNFLPKNNLELWSLSITTYYHNLYIKIVIETIHILQLKQQYDSIQTLCFKALTIDPYDEEIHYRLINSLFLAGKYRAGIQHYHKVKELFLDKFGVEPSEKLHQLYQDMNQHIHSVTFDLARIQQEMTHNLNICGAYYCDYSVFQDIYLLESRSIYRTGDSLFLCLMTAEQKSTTPLKPTLFNHIMDQIGTCIQQSLRSTDVYSRYSICQYVILLPTANCELGLSILKRIRSQFKQRNPICSINLIYDLRPVTISID